MAVDLGYGMAGTDRRSCGFNRRTPLETAVKSLLDGAEPLPSETVESANSWQRTLQEPVVAVRDVPAFARSAMDGFALAANATTGATEACPVVLRIEGKSLPGHPPDFAVGHGGSALIMTGAALPLGTNAVVPVEACLNLGATVEIHQTVPPGRHVCAVGEDFRMGQVVLQPGRWLRPHDLALLSALGICEVRVVRQPRVAILVTGDEILPPFSSPAGDRICDANSPMLQTLIQRDGGRVHSVQPVADNAPALSRALAENEGADLILISGGSSVGQEDHAPGVLTQLGTLDVHGLALRPASPVGFGRLNNGTRVMLLPGNPVSCLCAYELLAGRLIRRLAGRRDSLPHPIQRLPLTQPLDSVPGRTDFVRVRILHDEVEPIQGGASMLSTLTRADGFVLIPHDSPGRAAGDRVDVHLFENG